MRPYILTAGAAADVQEIARYTQKKWGAAKREAYIQQIETAASELATGRGVFRERGIFILGCECVGWDTTTYSVCRKSTRPR